MLLLLINNEMYKAEVQEWTPVKMPPGSFHLASWTIAVCSLMLYQISWQLQHIMSGPACSCILSSTRMVT